MKNTEFSDLLKETRIFFDGAMGTAIQAYDLSSDDYLGKDGCPEILNISRPQLIQSIHESFLKVGSHVVETNTFGASSIVLGEYDLQDRSYEISKASTALAEEVVSAYDTPDRPRFVAASIGPGLKLPSLQHIDPASIYRSYQPQIRGAIDGGADLLLVETSQDMLHAKTVLRLIHDEFKRASKYLPVILSVTIERSGTMLVGSDITTVLHTFADYPLTAMGINCATGPADMADAVRTLHDLSPFPSFVMPNAGIPKNVGGEFIYDLDPLNFGRQMHNYVGKYALNIIGGCCGTTAEHIRRMIENDGENPVYSDMHGISEVSVTSLYSSQALKIDPPPLLIGERTNASGSKKFRELLLAEDLEAMVDVASSQIAEGAHILDVNVAYVGRDEKADMLEFIRALNTASSIPLQIDSTDPDVMELALQHAAGKCILNSANLEDGEDKFDRIAALARDYSAALIMLTIDEEGMAKQAADKLRIARRMINRAVERHGLKESDLIIDPLTFTLAAGDEDSNDLAIQTLEAIKNIKKEFPQVSLLLGLSNISFGLKPRARHVLNSVMLSEAVKNGLDAAIVHAGRIKPLNRIPRELQELALDLIYNRPQPGENTPLMRFIQAFENLARDAAGADAVDDAPIEEKLHKAIVNGIKKKIIPLLEAALPAYKPFDIINSFLLDGMKEVGELFGSGKMQLPFVLQSAETMKTAVAHLEQYMEKNDSSAKASMLLATVKGDVHDIGKNLVDIVVSNNGYRVHNIGIKQSVENILQAMEKYKPDVIGLSGLLVKSVQVMKENLEIFRDRDIRIPIILGGAALTRRYVENDLRTLYDGPLYYAPDAFAGLSLMDKISNTAYDRLLSEIKEITSGKKTAPKPSKNAAPNISERPQPAPDIPARPFAGIRHITNVSPDDCIPYLNFNTLFRGQWRLKKTPDMSKEAYEKFLEKEGRGVFDELLKENEVRAKFDLKYSYGFVYCSSEEEKLHLYHEKKDKIPFATWAFRRQRGGGLAIPDYFRPKCDSEKDILGLQIVTAGEKIVPYLQKLYDSNEYQKYLYLNGIFAEMAEALAELVHARIRREWGYDDADGERGKRYSFGYPACPDLQQQKELMEFLQSDKLGLSLSEEYQIHPEFSTSAFVLHHPQAKYFSV